MDKEAELGPADMKWLVMQLGHELLVPAVQ